MSLREATLIRLSTLTQKWLNIKKPPRRGRRFDQNVVRKATPNSLVLANKNGPILVSPFNQGILRVYLQSVRHREAWWEQNSWAVDLANINRDGWRLEQAEDATLAFTLADGLQASFSVAAPAGLISYRIGPDLVLTAPLPPQTTKQWLLVDKRLPRPGGVRVFGLGENTPPMDKAGQRVVMWNTDNSAYRVGDTPLYKSLPVAVFQYIDGPALGLVFDNPGYAEFDFSADGKRLLYSVNDTELSYYLLLGPSLPEVMRQLTTLTGNTAPLPKWAFGYQQSRWSYAPSARLREIAAEFRNRDIPCDVLYLDIDYMDRYKCFTWGEGFADSQDLIRELHRHGFKIVVILNPGIKTEPGYHAYDSGVSRGVFVTDRNGKTAAKKVWPGSCYFPDFLNNSVGEWWAELIRDFAASGVDGIWCDMNEPSTFDCRRTLPPDVQHRLTDGTTFPHGRVHNVYSLMMCRATHAGLQENTRLPYVITRSTYLGGQQFAATWTGDNASDWDHFKAGIPMLLNLGLSGQPVTGPDIGGFRGTPSPELYERWILQGALYPYCRTHTSRGTGDQEPWSFGEKVEASARRAIKLRYRLVPYLYSLAYEAAQTGQPIMRPIFFHTPTAETLKPEYYETEFLLGPCLLVAPLMSPGSTRTYHLPPGQWYSWWCRKGRQGGQTYQTRPDEDTDLPLFVRENTAIPLYPDPLSHIPGRSLPSLELFITVTGKTEGLIVDYFDRDSLLAYAVKAAVRNGHLEISVDLIRKGDVPVEYQPPETLHFLLNHRLQQVEFGSSYRSHSVVPDPATDPWTRITVTGPAFPLRAVLS
ncbi:MAG: alpha-glucosidase [Candidatus Desulforudis sp.]|nr:alpha-glucosidase [Desulforudis sp.]